MLIFRHADAGKVDLPCYMQDCLQQTMDWLSRLAATGNFEGKSNGLVFNDAHVVHHNNVVTDGPFGEIKETLGGYVVLKATSMSEAIEFAKGCPVLLDEGNTVEVRAFSADVTEAIAHINLN
jgi:hypothetical protein